MNLEEALEQERVGGKELQPLSKNSALEPRARQEGGVLRLQGQRKRSQRGRSGGRRGVSEGLPLAL